MNYTPCTIVKSINLKLDTEKIVVAMAEKFWVTKYSAKMGFCCISLCEIEIDCLIRVIGIYFSNNLSIHLKVSEIGSSF